MPQDRPAHPLPPSPFAPSRYMRERRAYLFSDSTINTEPVVTREVLSYHLETLTNQKDETTFETFALHLCEKFVSPNLRPQTGPTGGGDGKTDTETYPVAEEIAQRWFVPDTAGAHERWAFAFSAKREWRPKVNSDVASIVGTGRGYPRIYFVTNQYVPSKDSAAVQDALAKKHGVPVTILDRTWILDRVFDDDSLDIAVADLGVGRGAEREVKALGPKDFERAAELEELEKAIGDGTKYNGTVGALAEDCLRAALLARGLEKPKVEVEGRFNRAIRIARQHNLPKQELAAVYNWAWTNYFWYDDPRTLSSLYDDVECMALGTEDADEIENLTNLLPLLITSVRTNILSLEEAKLEKRSASLTESLNRIVANTSRPNNSLHARSLSLLVQVSQRAAARTDDPMIDIWTQYKAVFEEAEGLGTYPFGSFADVLTELGNLIPESKEFDDLFDAMTSALAVRRSEGEAAKKNCERGYQKLRKDLPYEAIRWFGKTISLLVKEEYEDELMEALVGSSFAYEQAGLLWAARNCALAAASHQFTAFRRQGSISSLNPAILRRFFWTEARLGRLPFILSAHYLEMAVRSARAKNDEQRQRLEQAQTDHGGIVGALLLRSRLADLALAGQLPDTLERIGMAQARLALLFAMGHEETLRGEGSIPESETSESVQAFFEQWYDEGAEMELPAEPDYMSGDFCVMRSPVLGCDVQVECANNLSSIGIGEAVLGTLEALLATSLSHRILPHCESFRIRVAPADDTGLTPTLTFADDSGETIGIISHAAKLTYATREEVLSFPNWLKDASLELLLKFAMVADPEAWGKAVFGEENAFSRALTFSHIPLMLDNMYSNKLRVTVDEWREPGDVDYPVKRSQPWKTAQPKAEEEVDELAFGEGTPPPELFDFEHKKHSDIKILSPIDVQKWNDAKWAATMFMVAPYSDQIQPALGLAFRNRDPAIAIFESWRTRFGLDDPKNDLRIAIIRGISAADPLAYVVTVGSNFDNFSKSQGTLFGAVSRMNWMRPSSPKNLEIFLAAFRRQGRFLLAPAHFPSDSSSPEMFTKVGLGKYHLAVRDAWEIGEHDPDIIVIDPDDPPVIPDDKPDAPVLKALARKARK
jgi:hypothetical protein